MRACAILAVILSGAALAADEKEKDRLAVKEIQTKDLKLIPPRNGKVSEPTTVTSAEDLAKNEVTIKAADEIRKHIDFGKEKLVVFAWGGADKDKLVGEFKSADKSIATSAYTAGEPRDFRTHFRLFVIPKEAEVKIAAVRAIRTDAKLLHAVASAVPKVEIASADELAKATVFVDDAGRDAVKKEIDFAREKLVVFAWRGFNGVLPPSLTTKGEKTIVVFPYKDAGGDYQRNRAYVFAVPKDAEVQVEMKK